MRLKLGASILAVVVLTYPALGAERKLDKSKQAVAATDELGWITTEDYPDEALRADKEGTVAVRLDINAAGQPTNCTVTQASGSTALDTAACDALRKRAVFVPGKAGRIYIRKVTWRMPRGEGQTTITPFTPTAPIDVTDPAAYPPSGIETEVVIGTNGAIESCKVIERKPTFIEDPCAAYPIGKNTGPGFVKNGKAVKAVQQVRWKSETHFIEP